MEQKYKINDLVVYRRTKRSVSPGPRAEQVYPAAHGDSYAYVVDKYWRVVGVAPDNTLELATRTGKRHQISADDPNLRKARMAERIILKTRFPSPVEPSAGATS